MLPCSVERATRTVFSKGTIVISKLASVLFISLIGMGSNVVRADPTAELLFPNSLSFVEYGLSEPVGSGAVDSSALYWIEEKRVGSLQSWLVFFDPPTRGLVGALIDFGRPIVAVLDTKAGLEGTSFFEKPGTTYSYAALAGLEDLDQMEYSGSRLALLWSASDPGDHVRILTLIPEPNNYLLLMTGMLVIGVISKRRVRS